MAHEMKWRYPAIIAMKGYPYTGKSTIANEIGMLLGYCTIIRLDNILDSIKPTTYASSSPPPEIAKQLHEIAFDILCKLTETQLNLGISVVIDSPLSLESHFTRLIDLMYSIIGGKSGSQGGNHTGLIIVECKSEEPYEWEMRFEARDPKIYQSEKWYKPKSWGDVEEHIRQYPDYSVNHHKVSKVTINIDRLVSVPGVFEAIKEINLRDESRDLVYDQWASNRSRHRQQGLHYSHAVSVFHESWISSSDANCNFCHEKVRRGNPAYECNSQSCGLVLHQKCAETSDKNKWGITPQKFQSFIQQSKDGDRYWYPKTVTCSSCQNDGEDFSYDCALCLFESHLECALVPTILHHEGHSKDHILFFHVDTVRLAVKYRCRACGGEGKYAKYMCNNIDCNAIFHVECALMPHSARNKHGGYEHVMDQIYSRQGESKDLEDYLCDLCEKKMSPRSWFYYCDDCERTYHMECMTFEDDF